MCGPNVADVATEHGFWRRVVVEHELYVDEIVRVDCFAALSSEELLVVVAQFDLHRGHSDLKCCHFAYCMDGPLRLHVHGEGDEIAPSQANWKAPGLSGHYVQHRVSWQIVFREHSIVTQYRHAGPAQPRLFFSYLRC